MAARRRTPRRRIGAFFDMDKTLIAENSGALFMRYRYEQGQLSGWELASGLAAGDVLLLHDDRPRALEVLPALLDELAARGLKSVTLPSACSRF